MLTKQEMMDRAVAGLASQGFTQCKDATGACVYSSDGKHCAWGWVDTSVTTKSGTVRALRERGDGLAAHLDDCTLDFAWDLQVAHDTGDEPQSMRKYLRVVCRKNGLVIPSALLDNHAGHI